MEKDLIFKMTPLILGAVSAVALLILKAFLPNKLPLFYSLPWGEAQLAQFNQLFIIPALTLSVALLNLIIFWHLHQNRSFFRKMLLTSSFIFALILTITLMKIVLIYI